MKARVTFLGSGTSHGVPMIGCTCDVCRSTDVHDRRTRPSVYLQVEGGPSVLVDTSTDFRAQALAHGIDRLDAILFTHSHADHIMGLDDVRRFNTLQGGPIPVFADPFTCDELRRTFAYIFEPPQQVGGGIPQIGLTAIDGPFTVGDLRVQPIPIFHGKRPILGFRFGRFAYLTDASRLPDGAWPLLQDLDVLVINALRHRAHSTHFSVAEAAAVAERLQPKQTWLTHICHDLPHAATNRSLPASIQLAYDGLALSIDAGPAWT